MIVSTGTKTLQDQLFHRDLPRVRAALGVAVDTALLKGRANYVCLHHLEVARAAGRPSARARRWRTSTRSQSFAARTMTGDRGECADVPETSPAWAQATSTRENCLGSAARHYQDCFVMKARKRAAEADVIVVNHHLFFADVALRDEGAADLLPAANTVIFDEAHHLPDLARLFFGESLSTAQLVELARDARIAEAQHARESNEMGDAADDVEKAARDVRLALGNAAGRTALAAIRDRTALRRRRSTRSPSSSPCWSRRSQAQEERAEEIRNCRARAERIPRRAWREWREADARPREDAYGEAPAATWCAGSRPTRTRRRST